MMFLEQIFVREKLLRRTTLRVLSSDGPAIWADSVSPRMNTIASRDQFKLQGIGENFVVNYNSPYI